MLALALCLLGCLAPTPAAAKGTGPKLPHPGFRTVGIWNPDRAFRMDVAVWYPSSRAPRDITLEGWNLTVSQNGTGVPGRYPVILLSHSAATSRLASHTLAAALARHGFMVIAPTHPGDNTDETQALFHAALYAERPNHLLLALDAVEKSPILRPLMDQSRIGVLGVGAGAATALQLAGARPDLSLLATYCTPETAGDPLCSNWSKLFHARMRDEFAVLVAKEPDRFKPRIEKKPEPLSDDAGPSAIAPGLAPGTPPPSDEPERKNPVENGSPAPPENAGTENAARPEPLPAIQPVLAVGLLTPGQIDLFADAELRHVAAPVGILAGAQDTVYVTARSVERLQTLLPHRPTTRVLQNANHHDLQAPCPPAYRESFEALCGTRNPTAESSRKTRNDFFVRFFRKTLGHPAPPPPLPPN